MNASLTITPSWFRMDHLVLLSPIITQMCKTRQQPINKAAWQLFLPAESKITAHILNYSRPYSSFLPPELALHCLPRIHRCDGTNPSLCWPLAVSSQWAQMKSRKRPGSRWKLQQQPPNTETNVPNTFGNAFRHICVQKWQRNWWQTELA